MNSKPTEPCPGCDEGWRVIGKPFCSECYEGQIAQLRSALAAVVNAKALKGVRGIVAGWNGEGRDEPFRERHPKGLGATLPKTNCGAVYELDEAMQVGRALLGDARKGDST
jgi:hypothetical protein